MALTRVDAAHRIQGEVHMYQATQALGRADRPLAQAYKGLYYISHVDNLRSIL